MVDDKTQELSELINSDLYRAALEHHVQQGLKVVPMDPRVALMLAAKAVAASKKEVAALVSVLQSSPVAFANFVTAKIRVFANDKREDYPPGEVPPKEERPKTLALVGYPETFLVAHLCEFAIASSNPGDLEGYAKRFRLPGATKYAKEVLHVFREACKTSAPA